MTASVTISAVVTDALGATATAVATAQASSGGSPYAAVDGSADASIGPAQFPTLLNKYVSSGSPRRIYGSGPPSYAPAAGGHQPPWYVAGVDYAVGPSANVTMVNAGSTIQFNYPSHGFAANQAVDFYPMTGCVLPSALNAGKVYYVSASNLTANSFQISASSGGAVISAFTTGMVGSFFYCLKVATQANLTAAYGTAVTFSPWFRIIGSNVTFNGWDFTPNGLSPVIDGGSNVTITNCVSMVTATNGSENPFSYLSGTNLTVTHCLIDQGAALTHGIPTNGLIACQTSPGGAGITLKYNWLRNSAGHMLEFYSNQAGANTNIIAQFNLLNNVGCCASFGAHGNISYFQGGPVNFATETFNTFYNQPVSQIPNMAGATYYGTIGWDTTGQGGGRNTNGFTCSYNVGIADPDGNCGDAFINGNAAALPGPGSTITYNYVDPSSGIYGGNPAVVYGNLLGSKNVAVSNNYDMTSGAVIT